MRTVSGSKDLAKTFTHVGSEPVNGRSLGALTYQEVTSTGVRADRHSSERDAMI